TSNSPDSGPRKRQDIWAISPTRPNIVSIISFNDLPNAQRILLAASNQEELVLSRSPLNHLDSDYEVSNHCQMLPRERVPQVYRSVLIARDDELAV
ncbi:hypothetical protein BGX23_004928, partial [Mortierella sp. AD031]